MRTKAHEMSSPRRPCYTTGRMLYSGPANRSTKEVLHPGCFLQCCFGNCSSRPGRSKHTSSTVEWRHQHQTRIIGTLLCTVAAEMRPSLYFGAYFGASM